MIKFNFDKLVIARSKLQSKIISSTQNRHYKKQINYLFNFKRVTRIIDYEIQVA